MSQEIKDVPKTEAEYRRQKGPVPLIAIVVCVCLLLAFTLFVVPSLMVFH